VYELVRLRAGRSGNDVAAANWEDLLAKPIFTVAGHDEEQLVLHMMTVEGKSLLAWWNDVHRATEAIEPDQRRDAAPFHRELLAVTAIYQRHDAAPFHRELLAVTAIYQRHVVDIDHDLFGHSHTPSQTDIADAAHT